MRGELYIIVLMLIITGIILLYSYKINEFNVEGIIFGIRVPEKYRENQKVKDSIKEYNRNITIVTLIGSVIFLSLYYVMPKSYCLLIYIYYLLLINICCFFKANSRLKIIKKELGWAANSTNKVYVQSVNKEIKKMNLNLFYTAGLISILGLIITVLRLPSLPKIVPIHFGINGPDGWADTTTLSGKLQVIGLPIISLICIWSMAFSAKFQTRKSLGNFNGGKISNLILRKQLSADELNKMLGILSIGISLLMFYSTLCILKLTEFTQTINYIFMIITGIIVIFPILYWVYRMKKVKTISSEMSKNEEEIYIDDDKYYIGGIFYFNPNDPSNIVMKRMGNGLDFNYAHTFGRVVLLISLGIMIAPIVVLAFFNI